MTKTEILFQENQLVILNKSEINNIRYEDIVGVFCDHPYLRLQILNKKSRLIFFTLEEIISCLPDSFILCNRSSIINLLYVNVFTTEGKNSLLHLTTGDVILVSRRKKAAVKERINYFLTVQYTFPYRSAAF